MAKGQCYAPTEEADLCDPPFAGSLGTLASEMNCKPFLH